ncbi:hypothetical protein B0H14DRAFT_3535807 [Mycena olivaceomarginata]|nr:hypothetical protein B0H14DRAFT_3535807 [Mycena olivaceomarginata]
MVRFTAYHRAPRPMPAFSRARSRSGVARTCVLTLFQIRTSSIWGRGAMAKASTRTCARPPCARAVPNRAFVRGKAPPLLHPDQVHILLGAGQTPTPCRPRECVVGLGVDRAPGCGLRFVYANARAVGV